MEEAKTPKKDTEKVVKEKAADKVQNVAVIRIRGIIGIKTEVTDTLTMLRLYRKNYCVVIPATKSNIGMVKKVKDYVTWGEISKDVHEELNNKRGSDKKFFRLHPPIGGFERKGIKKTFVVGGALGYRKDKINILIKKML